MPSLLKYVTNNDNDNNNLRWSYNTYSVPGHSLRIHTYRREGKCQLKKCMHPRSVGRSQVIWRFATKGRKSEHQRYFCELKKTRYLKLRNLALFYIWKDARVWAHWNHSFPMHLSCLEPVSCNISHPDIFSSHCREWLQSNGCQMVQVFFLSALEGWNRWWLWHPYVLIWQKIDHFSPRNNFRESYLSTTIEEKK